MKNIKILSLIVLVSCFICACASSKAAKNGAGADTDKAAVGTESTNAFEPFYVYEDLMSPNNHYAPSGWMGDVANLELDQSCSQEPHEGKNCIKLRYNAEGLKQWAGIYWQHPANNWGDKKGGYNLTGATKLTFWARGANGYEVISEVKMGGISGTFADSDVAWLKTIKLTGSWKKYTIDLSKSDLSSISGGFCIVFSKKDNPRGCTIFLDDIRYE
ncbi:MAG: hypothetical protein K5622_02030 [Endomicrobiaceae bacterium]|nr:hypothetical protein [Endomicrobiaceae bacterium]